MSLLESDALFLLISDSISLSISDSFCLMMSSVLSNLKFLRLLCSVFTSSSVNFLSKKANSMVLGEPL